MQVSTTKKMNGDSNVNRTRQFFHEAAKMNEGPFPPPCPPKNGFNFNSHQIPERNMIDFNYAW